MKRGIFQSDKEYFEWWNQVKLNTHERRDLTISLLNEEHEPVMVWKVQNAWPTKIQSPDLAHGANLVRFDGSVSSHKQGNFIRLNKTNINCLTTL